MTEYTLYHVTRNLAKHSLRLDDYLYGAPSQGYEEDWAVKSPQLYLQRLNSEKMRIDAVLDDMLYLMREKHITAYYNEPKMPSLEEADAHVYHKFHHRSFSYAEKLAEMLQNKSPEDIEVNVKKLRRQVNVLQAAQEDILNTLVRFSNLANQN